MFAALALTTALSVPAAFGDVGEDRTVRLGRPGPARTAPPFVQVDTLGGGAFVLSAGTANVAAVLTRDGWIVVDTGTRLEAQAIRDELRRLADRPVRLVFDTHFHDDHAGGNALYLADHVPVVASRRTQALAQARASRVTLGAPLEIARLEDYKEALPESPGRERLVAFYDFLQQWWSEALAEVAVDSLAIAPPNETFEHVTRRTVAGVDVEAHAFGPAHTGGDAIVFFPAQKVVAVGDVFARGSAPWVDQFMGDGSMDGLLAVQDSILARIPEADTAWVIVPGHGRVARRADLAANRKALGELRACARGAFEVGRKRAKTAEDCAGLGFEGSQGGMVTWLFYEEWGHLPKPDPGGRSSSRRSSSAEHR
ncbi:MAG: MBL fold metallo-hydrolase [Candidatus Eiseniibacteriota bacterium]